MPVYFHGGPEGLSVGDHILPRVSNPCWEGISLEWQGVPAEELGDNGTTVSLTTDRNVARAYAGEYKAPPAVTPAVGQVYEVRPLSDPEVDPDWKWSHPTISRCLLGAEIIAVHERVEPQSDPRVLVRALAPYYTYTRTGALVYDEYGYVRFTNEMESLGHTENSLRALGKWPEKHRYINGPS